MEILIMELSPDKKRYIPIYSDNVKIKNLGTFFHERSVERALDWVKNPENGNLDSELINVELEEEMVKIHEYFFENTMEDLYRWYNNAFTISLEKFKEVLEGWKETISKKPHFIIIKKENDDIFFEEEHRDKIELDLSKAKLTEDFFRKILEQNVKNNLFYGGFHLKSKKIEMSNKQIDECGTFSFNIKFDGDFNFNHAFFPSGWDRKKLELELSNMLKGTYTLVSEISDKKTNYFSIWEVSSDMIVMRILINKNLKVISCYPIFKGIQ